MKILGMKIPCRNTVLAGLFSVFSTTPAHTEDIDLFTGVDPSLYGNPNVLIILDNTSNWARASQGWPGGIQQGQSEVSSIRQAISGLGTNAANVNIGLFEFVTEGSAGDDGGKVRYAIRPMTGTSTTGNFGALNTTLTTIYGDVNDPLEKRNSNTPYGNLMYDAYNYFAGASALFPSAVTGSSRVDNAGYTTAWSKFRSPLSSVYPCARNYIIFIANPNSSGPKADSGSNTSALAALGGNTSQLPLPNFTSTTTAVTQTIGTTDACYSSCNTSEFASCSDGTYSSCSCSGPSADTGATCAAGTQRYSVFGTNNAGAYNLGYTTACYSNESSCKTDDYASQCTGTGITCACSSSNYDTTGCDSKKKKYMVVQTRANTTEDNLGYTTACFNSLAACSTSDYATLCSTYNGGCRCSTPTITSSACPSGQNKWVVTGTSDVTLNTPDGTYTADTNTFNADEWARFMYQTGPLVGTARQPVTTYTIDVYNKKPNAQTTSLLINMAKAGGGKYFNATNEQAIVTALTNIFTEIQAVNSTFASASLPVSVNTQNTYLNQVFIGMFRPTSNRTPRWLGNMKQYQIGYVDGSLVLADKNGNSAVNYNTGFVSPSAVSFWTTSTANYWPDTSTYFDTAGGRNESPDGEIVEKGGAAQHLRALASETDRVVKTCGLATCNTLLDFDTTNTGLSSNLVNWTRGAYLSAAELASPDDTAPPSGYAIRRSVHGDVVHSRPLAIDFGSAGSPDVKVFYGANDGFLHAITANKGDSEGGEMWSFVAPEHWSKLQRLFDNSPCIDYPGPDTSSSLTCSSFTAKDYFFDGPIGYYRNEDASQTLIYPTMRRGGRVIYGFDVSTPSSPSLMWRRGCNSAGCETGWEQIGQTWSEPKAIKVNGYTNPVLIMGGGYDTCEDADPVTDCSSTKGNRVYLIDALDGTLLRTLGSAASGTGDAIARAVAADVTPVDTQGDGYAELAYAADTGGNIYRVKIAYSTENGWNNTTVTKIASLGCSTAVATCTESKFLYAPEVIAFSEYNAILIGSGDREHPLSSNSSNGNNAFFMLQDHSDDASQPLIGRNLLATVDTSSNDPVTIAADQYGWKLPFTHTKEAVVTSAIFVGGYAYFSTYAPSAPSSTECTANLGSAYPYAVNWLNATALPGEEERYSSFVGGGLAPTPVAATVLVDVEGVSTPVDIIIGGIGSGGGGGGGGSICIPTPINVCPDVFTPPPKRSSVYWYLEK